MKTDTALSVAIIGGGFCGSMTLVQLARKAKTKIHVSLFYKSAPLIRGTAFSTYSDNHLLNVAAKNMSAFPDRSLHFVEWLHAKEEYSNLTQEEVGKLFVPRNQYGEYLEAIWKQTLDELPPHVSCSFINAEIISIVSKEGRYELTAIDGHSYSVDKIVLASGNQLPRPPLPAKNPFLNTQMYFPNPWSEDCVKQLKKNESVLIIGTGLTMIDVVIGLLENNFEGKIISVSPKGFHILPHRPIEPYTDILDEIKPPYELVKLFRIFRKHIHLVKSANRSGETVVDALRPKTQELWQALNIQDKKKFMTHVRHLWGVARHRLPSSVFEMMQALIESGRLEILAGRIHEINQAEDFASVIIQNRKDSARTTYKVQRIINCTGPESDPKRFNSSLYSQMLKDVMICCDEMQLGVKAKSDGRIIDLAGNINENMFALGSLLRGTLWETTAVPELRTQAENTAVKILS